MDGPARLNTQDDTNLLIFCAEEIVASFYLLYTLNSQRECSVGGDETCRPSRYLGRSRLDAGLSHNEIKAENEFRIHKTFEDAHLN
jgi:hypothetical protein